MKHNCFSKHTERSLFYLEVQMVKKCIYCNSEIKCRNYIKKKQKYCSHKCYSLDRKNKPVHPNSMKNIIVQGEKTRFKKGQNLRNNHPRWKGGKVNDGMGYIMILNHQNPRADKRGYVRRTKLVFEKQMNRLIGHDEIIHHINFNKSDDRPENLFVFENTSEHTIFHLLIQNNPFLKTWLKSNII